MTATVVLVRAPVTLVLTTALLLAGCSSAAEPDPAPSPASSPGPASTATSAAAPATPGTTEQRQQALASVPEALVRVAPAQRDAACTSFRAGPEQFLTAFEGRFDAVYSPITPEELATVKGTLEQVCTG